MEVKTQHEACLDMVTAVRSHVLPPDQCHAFAMLAKESVFRAKDMLYDVEDDALHDRMRKRLDAVRAELEALDRDWRRR